MSQGTSFTGRIISAKPVPLPSNSVGQSASTLSRAQSYRHTNTSDIPSLNKMQVSTTSLTRPTSSRPTLSMISSSKSVSPTSGFTGPTTRNIMDFKKNSLTANLGVGRGSFMGERKMSMVESSAPRGRFAPAFGSAGRINLGRSSSFSARSTMRRQVRSKIHAGGHNIM